MKVSELLALLFGIGFGLVLLLTLLITVTPDVKELKGLKLLVTECESKLSRDQFCELVAIPKVDK